MILASRKMRVVSASPGMNIPNPYLHVNPTNSLHSHIKGKASHKIVSDGKFPIIYSIFVDG